VRGIVSWRGTLLDATPHNVDETALCMEERDLVLPPHMDILVPSASIALAAAHTRH